jgi:DNA-binding NarL/FixJ family response regulator
MALVIGLATFGTAASEGAYFHDIQRYCTACWRNARLDPGVWDDCTQEVCCRLLGKARSGELDLSRVLAEDSTERRELARAIDMVRKRVQRTRKFASFDAAETMDNRARNQLELGEILESARRAVLSDRQGRIVDLWMSGWTVPEIAIELKLPPARVSDEKYKALRKLEARLEAQAETLGLRGASSASR